MGSTSSQHRCAQLLKTLENAVRCSQSLPHRDELQLIRVTSPSLKQHTNQLATQLVSEIKSLSSRYAVCIPSSDTDSTSSQSTASVSARDSLYDFVTETTDEALQHFNTELDAARNIHNAVVPPQGALNPSASNVKVGTPNLGRSYGGFLHIEKPQIHFPDYPIDNSHEPFIPPYSAKNQDEHFKQEKGVHQASNERVDTYLQELFKKNSHSESKQRHPYETEILSAQHEMASKKFTMEETIVFKPMKSTPCSFVTSEEELFNVAERLKKATAIAVDIEHHSVRSFQGFICLLQISTREEDIIIDTLKLRGAIHRALAPIFTDDTIVKVLHGADKDVQWLERDFGVYVVNMFDTGQASRLLKLPSASLAFLLTHFCDVRAISKKKFQLADWRQRPLPHDMFNYARSDTHYLLYIYDRLRAELAKRDLLEKAWERSASIAKKRHKKAQFQPGIAKHLAARHALGLDEHQIRLLEELCKWRDATAREEDESLPYVSPLKVLFGVVRARDKARTVEGFLKYGFPGGLVPPLMYKNADKLTQLIRDALDAKIDDRADAERTTDQGDRIDAKIDEVVADDSNSCSDDSRAELALPAFDEKKGPVRLQSAERKRELPRIEFNLDTKLRLTKLSRSTLLDSDLESESDTESNSARLVENGSIAPESLTNDCARQGKTSQDCGDKARPSPIEAREISALQGESEVNRVVEVGSQFPCAGKNDETVPETLELEVDATQMTQVDQPTKSVFDLSDFSEAEDEPQRQQEVRTTQDTVASVRAEIAAENSRKMVPNSFRVETDKQEVSQERISPNDEVTKVTELEKDKAEKVVSLLEAARGSGTERPAKRRKKRSVTSLQEEMKPMRPFDYDKAIADEDIRRKSSEKRTPKVFNPMQKLNNDSKSDSKKLARKRKRVRGRSMSFKAK